MNYKELKNLVRNYINRGDLPELIGNWINAGIKDVERLNNWKSMEARMQTITDEVYISLPERYKETNWLQLIDGTRHYQLKRLTQTLGFFSYPDEEENKGMPVFFTILPAHKPRGEILLRPTPDKTYKYDFYFYQYSPELISDEDTNWWTENAWDIVLYSALIQAEPFLQNDERLTTWKALFNEKVINLRRAEANEVASGSNQAIGLNQGPQSQRAPV